MGVVFDADLGNTIDDALALAMLFGLQGKGEARVISVSTTKSSLKAAVFADILVRFFTGEPNAFAGPIPIGLSLSGAMAADTPIIEAVTGKQQYPRSIARMNDTADPLALIRNALSAQVDQNAVIVLTGPATNLAALIALPGSREWVASKVRLLAIAADAQLAADPAALQRVLAEWPTEIVAVPAEVGDALPFPASSIEKDFSWSTAHPLVEAYRAYRAMSYDAPATAMAAALYAVRPQENYWKPSEPGTLSWSAMGLRLASVAGGKHRMLAFDPAQKERILQAYAETASTKPVGRVQRFRPPQKKN
ncbi:MAG: hypothetical protein JWP63_7002 [Candidatus Solibacter sp.]|nr:hypothetical protein [Candidatus Solibacter sp.]